MRHTEFIRYIDDNDFAGLFNEMGWNYPHSQYPLSITIDDTYYDFSLIADKCGFQVFTCEVDAIPANADCKKIDNQLRRQAYDYICIFILRDTNHHLWLTPVKTNEKRELVKTEYIGGGQAGFLWSKVDDLSFGLTEKVELVDVKQRVHGSFHLNSEQITKSFYAQFRKEHKAFATHIEGLATDKDKDWYTSVMLNRLMFCYFIQKKGFLDNNKNYLQEKLHWVKEMQGEDKFFGTFYKGFLCAMFHEGLNHPRHDTQEFLAKYGRIPYLNGGMFDDHQLEKENEGLDIADIAFERLFDFFDTWNWHLDTRLTASGKDINPDVLGYIFEQYINDRAAMGAYYTKEDITEYIGKNCIIPFLMDKTENATKDSAEAFKPTGFVWQMLRDSGDKYIYDAVKKGYTTDWQSRIPENISIGIDTQQPDLLERRKDWNTKTPDVFALPTEIWRETVERFQRCDSLRAIISNYPHSPEGGTEGGSINDFITYNLDIRQFTEDLIRNTDDRMFVAHFYHALQNVTILDPTCGSGAFLFAALSILEPLYEACLDRMEEWHKGNDKLFARELDQVNAKYSSNRQYFIYKSIILRNLYGVDIMVEATEIAKLRLFLKMVAVVEVDKRKENLGLDPLPDIDFNIKCGNTLVGYATEKELDTALAEGDMFAAQEFKGKISTMMNVVATAYNCFRSEQLKTYDDNASIKQTKDLLKQRLAELNDLLNHHMYDSIARGTKYEDWLNSHQPFHWLAEFYQIIKGNGGFDVIIGNPPYVVYTKKDSKTKKSVSDYYSLYGYKTLSCNNLYAFVMERMQSLTSKVSKFGMIIPISCVSNEKFIPLLNILLDEMVLWHSSYSNRPGKLFENVEQRLTICVGGKGNTNNRYYASAYQHWNVIERPNLFNRIYFEENRRTDFTLSLFKVGKGIEKSIYSKLTSQKIRLGTYLGYGNKETYYHNAPTYFVRSMSYKPNSGPGMQESSHYKLLKSDNNAAVTCILNSSIFYWFYKNISNCRDFGDKDICAFPIGEIRNLNMFPLDKELSDSYNNLKAIKNRVYDSGVVYYEEYYPAKSKPIIDEIDKVLAKHYGFTDEELDFIINYDIKYRMGDELTTEE